MHTSSNSLHPISLRKRSRWLILSFKRNQSHLIGKRLNLLKDKSHSFNNSQSSPNFKYLSIRESQWTTSICQVKYKGSLYKMIRGIKTKCFQYCHQETRVRSMFRRPQSWAALHLQARSKKLTWGSAIGAVWRRSISKWSRWAASASEEPIITRRSPSKRRITWQMMVLLLWWIKWLIPRLLSFQNSSLIWPIKIGHSNFFLHRVKMKETTDSLPRTCNGHHGATL